MQRDEAELLVKPREGLKIAIDHVDDRLDDGVALLRRQERHHAKVDVDQLTRGAHEQVAQVRVGVEEAVGEHLAQ